MIRERLPLYVKNTPDKQFRVDPERYLKRRAWDDEIITETAKSGASGASEPQGGGKPWGWLHDGQEAAANG